MNARVVAVGLVAGVLLLPRAWSAMAARGTADTLDVYDLLPKTVDRARVSAILNRKARREVRVIAVDATLLSPLQWAAPDPGRASCEARAADLIAGIEATGRVSPPESAAGLFDALLEQAEQQFLYVDFHGVLESVEQAKSVLPCTDRVVEKAQLRSLYLHEAAAYLHLGDPRAGETFVQMLAVDPRVYLEPEHPPRVRKAFLEAAERFMALTPRPLDSSDLPGKAYLDGLPVENVNEVRPGKHLVQLEGPGGHIRSVLCEIPAGAGPVALATLIDVGLPDAQAVLGSLVAGLRSRSLDQALTQGLETYLTSTGAGQIAFALLHDGLTVEIYRAGEGLVDPAGDTYGEYFRSRPPWKGAEPASPVLAPAKTEGLGLLSAVRAGVGGALGGPSAWGGMLELDLYKRVGSAWYPGLFGVLAYQSLDAGVSYPQARIGAVLARHVPLSAHLAFLPAVGYGFGKGPPVEGACTVVAEGGAEYFSCTPDSSGQVDGAESYEVVLASSSHGPVMRLELILGGELRSLAWSAGLGIQGSYEFLSIHDGNVTSGDTVWPYAVASSKAGGVVVVNTVVSFGLEF